MLYSDSAYFYENNSLDAFGHVHINQSDSIHLYGDVLKYNGNSKLADVSGKNLRLSDKDMTLYTQRIKYDVNNGQARYDVPGRIVNRENTLTSKRGLYLSKKRDLYFSGDVVLTNPDHVLKSDSLTHNMETEVSILPVEATMSGKDVHMYCGNGIYDRKKEITKLYNNAWITKNKQTIAGDTIFFDDKQGYGFSRSRAAISDSSEKVFVYGSFARYFRENDRMIVTGKAEMQQHFEKDTLFMHADTLLTEAIPDSSQMSQDKKGKTSAGQDSSSMRRLQAWRNVQFFKSDFQGLCDSLVYSEKDSTMRFFGTPVLWSGANQLTGEFVRLIMFKGHIHKLYMNNKAMIVSREDSTLFNQIKGKDMEGFFDKDELVKILVIGNGQALYYAKDEKQQLIGANRADCSDMLIRLEQQDVKSITMYKEPSGTMYPIKDLPATEKFLKDFYWLGMYKPQSREDIFKQKTLPDEFRVSVTGKRMKAQKNKKEKTKDKENNKSKTENNGKQP
jgi:lipopolysaccharide export system protein LptA